MAEDIENKADKDGQMSWRWRVFAIGGMLGLVFGRSTCSCQPSRER
jgi:hypothetical protein